MPTDDEWQELIDAADPPDRVTAEAFIKKLPGYSEAVLLSCNDGEDYAVKAQQKRAGRYHRALVADHLVGRLGQAMDAPVGQVTLVEVPQRLIEAEPEMSHCQPGLGHGCKWIPGCSEKARNFRDSPENRERFAELAILYGLAGANDQQVIYENQDPNLAHSVDHGHFLPPGSGRWDEASLRGRDSFEPDSKIVKEVSLSFAELQDAAHGLVRIDDETIAYAVASLPSDWGISLEERVVLADYFERGRQELQGEYGNESDGETEVSGDE